MLGGEVEEEAKEGRREVRDSKGDEMGYVLSVVVLREVSELYKSGCSGSATSRLHVVVLDMIRSDRCDEEENGQDGCNMVAVRAAGTRIPKFSLEICQAAKCVLHCECKPDTE